MAAGRRASFLRRPGARLGGAGVSGAGSSQAAPAESREARGPPEFGGLVLLEADPGARERGCHVSSRAALWRKVMDDLRLRKLAENSWQRSEVCSSLHSFHQTVFVDHQLRSRCRGCGGEQDRPTSIELAAQQDRRTTGKSPTATWTQFLKLGPKMIQDGSASSSWAQEEGHSLDTSLLTPQRLVPGEDFLRVTANCCSSEMLIPRKSKTIREKYS